MSLGILNIDDKCTGCGSCVNICPHHCLTLIPNADGFYYPKYDSENCINCSLCEKVCHVINQGEHIGPNKDAFFLYHCIDDNLRENSSSGGAFSLFAKWVLDQGGVVFGSLYNAKGERLEVVSTDCTTLQALRKSKYVESYTGNAFSLVRSQLKQGRKVLYCGTPCQVRGLRQYLNTTKTETANLILMDFACHGVPSNEYFKQFKRSFESKNKKIVEVDFRYKDFNMREQGWHDMTMRLGFSNGKSKVFSSKSYYFYFYRPFYDKLLLRKSCYTCDIALNSDADITVGDFWGINKHRKEIDDNKGVSFICFNTDKCVPIWDQISKTGFSEKLPYEAIEYQYKEKTLKPKLLPNRNKYAERVREIGYLRFVNEYYGKWNIVRNIFIYQIKTVIKQIILKQK